MDVSRSKKAEAAMVERVVAQQCVCGCGRPVNQHSRLGLARNCYYEHRETKKRMTKKQAAAYEANLYREGKLLHPHEVRRLLFDSVFQRAAKAATLGAAS